VTRAALALAYLKVLNKAGAPKLPFWDTENNFGLKGPGPQNPDVDIEGTKAASWVARTYLDALDLGMSRVYWYRWEPYNDLWGIQMFTDTPGASAYATLQDWIVGATFKNCNSTAKTTICNFTKTGKAFKIAYSKTEKPQTFAVTGTEVCGLLTGCKPLTGKKVTTAAPVKIG
jgi:hypothetical protein